MSLQSPPEFAQAEDGRHDDRPGPRAGRSRLVLIALLAVGLIGVAWAILGQDDDGARRSSGPTSPTTAAPTPTNPPVTGPAAPPTTAVPTAEDIVRARYFEFWRTYDTYAAGTGPFDPVEFKATFGPLAAGGEYTHLFDYFQTNRLKGLAVRGARSPEEDLRPSITLESDSEATVTDCAFSSGETYNVKTGEATGPANPTPERLIVVMRLEDGAWKVTSVAGQGEPCAR